MNEQDRMLEALVGVANTIGGEFAVGVTLSVHGAVISGLLVSVTSWMTDYENRLAKDVPPTEPDGVAGHGIANLFTGAREYFTKSKEEDNVVQDALDALEAEGRLPDRYQDVVREKQVPIYIHLKHAKFFHPAANEGMPGDGGLLWRGRLSEVDGWSLGGFGHVSPGN